MIVGGIQAFVMLAALLPAFNDIKAELAARPALSLQDAFELLASHVGDSWPATLAALAAVTVLGALYEVTMTYKWGATLGKLATGLEVRDATTFNRPTLKQCWLRWAGPSVFSGASSFSPLIAVLPLAGYVWCLVDTHNQAAHDHIAHTIVIHRSAPPVV